MKKKIFWLVFSEIIIIPSLLAVCALLRAFNQEHYNVESAYSPHIRNAGVPYYIAFQDYFLTAVNGYIYILAGASLLSVVFFLIAIFIVKEKRKKVLIRKWLIFSLIAFLINAVIITVATIYIRMSIDCWCGGGKL